MSSLGQGIVEKKFVANDIPTALALFGDRDRNLRALASNTMVSFVPRGNEVAIEGDAASVDKVLRVLDELAKIATEREVNLGNWATHWNWRNGGRSRH